MLHRPRPWLPVLALLALGACSLRDAACGSPRERAALEQAAAQAEAPAVGTPTPGGGGADTPFKIVVLGDSLTAGLGLLIEDAYPSILQRKFAAAGYDNVEVINAGVSGDTTAGGASRVEGTLEPGVRLVVVALGGNDALRALTPTQTHDNLAAILDTVLGRGVNVMLVGMEAPTNLGEDYQIGFRGVFVQLIREYGRKIAYVPFLLEGVAGNPALNQADGVHPNKAGAQAIAEHLYPKLRVLVDSLGGGG